MKKITVSEFFKNAHGNRVVKEVSGTKTAEDWPDIVNDAVKYANDNGFVESHSDSIDNGQYKIYDDKIEFAVNSGQVMTVMKPKQSKRQTGMMFVRSKDYYFVPDGTNDKVYGDKSGSFIDDFRLVKYYGAFKVSFYIS